MAEKLHTAAALAVLTEQYTELFRRSLANPSHIGSVAGKVCFRALCGKIVFPYVPPAGRGLGLGRAMHGSHLCVVRMMLLAQRTLSARVKKV